MPIDVHGNELNIKTGNWDHLFTEHGLESGVPFGYGGRLKSHWWGNESKIEERVFEAFQHFKNFVTQQPNSTFTLYPNPAGRVAVDGDATDFVGTGANGKPTKTVRIVLEVKHSGDCTLVTAFPL